MFSAFRLRRQKTRQLRLTSQANVRRTPSAHKGKMKESNKKRTIILITSGIAAFSMVIILLIYNGIIWHLFPDENIYKVYGIDISNHQGDINFDLIEEKYKFIFIKATEGDNFVDRKFYYNINKAKENFKYYGAYHFFHFSYDGKKQAENFIKTVGKNINLPPVIDIEFSGNSKEYNIEKVISELKNMASDLKSYYGIDPILYVTNDSYEKIIKNNFTNKIWLRSIIFPVNNKDENIIFWQYHDRALIKGINKKVDLNVYKGNLKELDKIKI